MRIILNLALGASFGTARAGVGISASAVLKPEFIMKSVIPVIMAGIIAIYGLVISVLIVNNMSEDKYSLYKYSVELFSILKRKLDTFIKSNIESLKGISSFSGRFECRSIRYGGRFRHRRCGRCGRSRHGSTTSSLRRHDSYTYFRRSVGSLRFDRIDYSNYVNRSIDLLKPQ